MTDLTSSIADLLRQAIARLENENFSLEHASSARASLPPSTLCGARIRDTEALKPALVWEAQKLIKARSSRAKYFPAELFGEPAWNILLDLYVCKARGQRITITSSCIASGVPPTTAIRYINLLVSMGLLTKSVSTADLRATYLELTGEAENLMDKFLRAQLDQY